VSAVPIFVLGLQRSGTTWLANCLAGHPAVAAVEAAEHRGIHESIFFSHFARAWPDLDDDKAFAAFAAAFTSSDYFLLSGCDPEAFRSLRPRDHAAAFRWVMEDVARRAGATHWLEKSPDHTMLGPDLAARFPDARFVAILRRPADLLRSRLWAFGRTPPGPIRRVPRVLRGGLSISLHARALEHFCAACERATLVRYEDLKADPKGVLARLGDFVGCGFHPDMLAERYAPNTSFADVGQEGPAPRLAGLDHGVLGIAQTLASPIPWSLLASIQRRSHDRRGVVWPDWCWRMRDHGQPG